MPERLGRVLRKALQPHPARRQQALSEFVHDLHEPGPEFTRHRCTPLQERHPLLLRRLLTLAFGLSMLVLLVTERQAVGAPRAG